MPKEQTSEAVASDASWLMKHADDVLAQAKAQIKDVEIFARLKKLNRCAKSVAASALTQREKN